MQTVNNFKDFNASTVPLEGSNLIEASAGTGKTYSIAILVLRLILEKKITIKEILMVTFTKAAVAELEERIRLFIRSAYQASNGEIIEDKTITDIVNESINKSNKEETIRLLKEAIIYLDETAVLTIHGFCQQTLNEFAFETNQLFGAELVQDTKSIIEAEVNKFWRKYITSIPTDILVLFGKDLTRNDLQKIIENHLAGKNYHHFSTDKLYLLNENYYAEIRPTLLQAVAACTIIESDLYQYILDNKERIKELCLTDATAKKNLYNLVDIPKEFIKYIVKSDAKYIVKLFPDIVDKIEEWEAQKIESKAIIQHNCNYIYYAAISYAINGVKLYKLRNNQLSFDDLITNLHTALVINKNDRLRSALQKKYQAVFIDEFQDTDREQYEIFKIAFGTNPDTVLFYIGDPKQSIYAWRKADVSVYFDAYKDVKEKYGMNENYRSSAAFINAMNLFFKPTPDFDTFYFKNTEPSINYIPVNSPARNIKGQLNFNHNQCVPIGITTLSKNEILVDAVVAQVVELLNNKNYTICKNNIDRSITPSDIGILVRKNDEGLAIKNALAKYKIPAITISTAKVLGSNEAIALLYILEAMINISWANINRALLCSFTGYTTEQILQINDELVIELFKKYKSNWDVDGVYTALMNFIVDFGIQQKLLNADTENGERIITNLYQLLELLHKVQSTKKLSPEELINWLKRGIENIDTQNDEYEQKVENDEEAIKIVTIHKSKGLEYNIVFAPHLDFNEPSKQAFCSYKIKNGNYQHSKKSQLSEEELTTYTAQNEQENRRLVYVAITRAVYKCFIYKNTFYKSSTLSTFINVLDLEHVDATLIEQIKECAIPNNYIYQGLSLEKSVTSLSPIQFNLLQQNWQRMSYTMLSAENKKESKGVINNLTNAYDQFIFSQLPKGSKTGNLLHHILENIHFANNNNWLVQIEKSIKQFYPSLKNEFEPMLMQMLEHILQANIKVANTTFTLAQVGFDKRIHEFEFDFPVNTFDAFDLQLLGNNKITINVKERYNLEGMMNGKIDMLFEYADKYFVLDWKSTFLGDSLKQYTPLALEDAMNENNYHLQYFIYTLATKKYLESRLPNFDYEKDFGGVLYLFIRGMRKGTESGLFYCKPSLKQLQVLEDILSKVAV